MTIRRVIIAFAVLGLSSLAGAAQAVEKTAVLIVDNVTCALCGPIVKMALERVPGVRSVAVEEAQDLSGAVATVEFDDALATVDQLVAATTDAGYPSRPVSPDGPGGAVR